MSIRLGFTSAPNYQQDFRGLPRRLVHFRDQVDFSRNPSLICEARDSDNVPCQTVLADTTEQTWCDAHHEEWQEITTRWFSTYQEVEQIVVADADIAREKVTGLRASIDIRRQIRDRFYPNGDDDQEYVEWMTEMETRIKDLAEALMDDVRKLHMIPRTPCMESPGGPVFSFENIPRHESPLDPKTPISFVQGLSDGGAIPILKHFYMDLCASIIQRLYRIVPDLYDGPRKRDSVISDNGNVVQDIGTNIVRAWFRIMILNDSDADTLVHATASKGIDQYLRICEASQLERYCTFFECAWQPQALQYLRTAIWAQTLAGRDIQTIEVVGGAIPSSADGFYLTKPCWDILYRWLPTILTPATLPNICSSFEDYKTICRLTMLGLYDEHWHDAKSILDECTTGVYLGLLPISKGDFTAEKDRLQQCKKAAQVRSRNYVCAQMSIEDPLAQAFLDEIQKRSGRLHLVVYEGNSPDAIYDSTNGELLISQQCTTSTTKEPGSDKWTTTATLEDIKLDLCLRRSSMHASIAEESWQIIILDKEMDFPFQLTDIVQDALLMLCGDPSPHFVANWVINALIPPSVQDLFLEQLSIECTAELRLPPPSHMHYEGNRFRSHKLEYIRQRMPHGSALFDSRSRNGQRTIRRIVEDMERCGIISLDTDNHEPPQTRPIIVQGADGAPDIYFPYCSSIATSPDLIASSALPPKSCLADFVTAFRNQHPNAVMAKGSLQTHYCAWPMPATKALDQSSLKFATWEGHVYRWNSMPFDCPSSTAAWQTYIDRYLNSRYPFVMFYLTTFVICAPDPTDAEHNAATLLEEMEDRGWRVTMPRAAEWGSDVEDLGLGSVFEGIRPAWG